MSVTREIVESPMRQGVDEQIVYTLTTTPWGSSPSSVSAVAKDITAANDITDVTSTVFPTNSPSPAGDVITLSPLRALTYGRIYRIEIKFTCSGNVFEAYAIIEAEL